MQKYVIGPQKTEENAKEKNRADTIDTINFKEKLTDTKKKKEERNEKNWKNKQIKVQDLNISSF